MLKKVFIFILSLFLLLVARIHEYGAIYHYVIWFSFFLACIIYVLSEKDYVLFWILLPLGLISSFSYWNLMSPLQFFFLNILTGTSSALWFYHMKLWERTLSGVEIQKNKVVADIRILQDKYQARADSLSHLEKQVSGLLDLFEVAKDFNECLYFDQLMQILERRVHNQMNFKRLSIVIKAISQEKGEIIYKAMSIGRENVENLFVRTAESFEMNCINYMNDRHQLVRFDDEKQIQELGINIATIALPLWIFPLHSEEKMNSIMILEGAIIEDSPKFELLASQLGLQVRKIGLYETVKELSIIDGLTKVYVRRHFLERFEEELRRAIKRKTNLSVLMLDIDHFKSYNDQFGHLVGDSTLREVAVVIRECVRKVDLVARYGGEEFIIVMPGIGHPANVEIAERIRSAVAKKHFRLYDEETKVTISIGIATFPRDAKDQNTAEFNELLMFDLIHKADKALYQAKDEGRNRVVCYD